MNIEYKHLVPQDFSPDSRVWVYQSNRLFSLSEALEIEETLEHFLENWNSHGTPVKGFASLFFGQYIILMADESATGVSGCSTDSSVRLVKELEQRFKVNLFDREMLSFYINDKVQLLPLSQLKYAADHHFISANTLYFNNLVQTKKEFEEEWILPIKESWLSGRIAFPETVS
ncbi:MAG TPA: hypothetical protein VJT83_08865 [Chitinophagaceae bacterium]|nr:hypothetical protein [Chitinophagaceae bacterium]